MNTPEFYGYSLGQNIVPYINKCIDETGECYVSEGIHVFGRNDVEWNKGHVWSDSTITWGWNRKSGVKLIGKGPDKTIFKFVDNVHSRHLLGKKSQNTAMLSTNFNQSCDDNLIEGITFDGNYDNNNDGATICAIKIRGKNNTIKGCKFINFGVGADQAWECFPVYCVPIDTKQQGPKILNNIFTSVGRKKNSKAGHCPEVTFVAVGGTNPIVDGNIFDNCEYDIVTQQSPLHAITIGESYNAEITNNIFNNFQGPCIYVDSWHNHDAIIKNNIAKNVWAFVALTCQRWPNENQISFNKNVVVEDNVVELTVGDVYYQWDRPPFTAPFFVYNYDPGLDDKTFPAFENIVIRNNKITLGYRILPNKYVEESLPIMCAWGLNVGENKIKFENNNEIISTVPEKPSLFKRIINWFKNLFGIS
jgi:hypothetical protein